MLSGGTGTPKLLVGLKRLLDPSELTVVANTADDIWASGNLVSPDLDTVTYTLAEIVDRSRWWGIKGDTFQTSEFLESLGHKEVLALGDKDRAIHIFRSNLIRDGATLSKATEKLCQSLKIEQTVVPMTDDKVSTMISTGDRVMHLQEFLVGFGGRPQVDAVRFRDIERARPSPQFIDALLKEDVILIGPSNPVTSVGPILALEGIRDILAKKSVIAVSPLVCGQPLSGPAAKFMQALGAPVSDQGVSDLLDCVNLMVVHIDSDYSGPSVELNTIMRNDDDSLRLAKDILQVI